MNLFQSLSKQHPENPDYRYQSAVTLMLMPTGQSDSITREQIEEVQKTANDLAEKSPNSAYVQLQIVSHLKLSDFHLSGKQPRKAIDELMDAAKLVSTSNLKGSAEKSMVRAVGQTARSITWELPPGQQRREFVALVQRHVKEAFKRHFQRGGRRRGPGTGAGKLQN